MGAFMHGMPGQPGDVAVGCPAKGVDESTVPLILAQLGEDRSAQLGSIPLDQQDTSDVTGLLEG
jgi:hypothetical protein